MKRLSLFLVFFCGLLLSSIGRSDDLPENVERALKQGKMRDPGSLWFDNTIDEPAFYDYVTKNWSALLDRIDTLPASNANVLVKNGKQIYAQGMIGVACEKLPPVEYVKFLDRWVALCEEGKIPFSLVESQLLGESEKNYFVAVNWEDARVKAILDRVAKLIPSDDSAMLSWHADVSAGKLADAYQANSSEFDPPPETLPGIKLRRPFASYIREPVHQSRATKSGDVTPSGGGESQPRSSMTLVWFAVGVILWTAVGWMFTKKRI